MRPSPLLAFFPIAALIGCAKSSTVVDTDPGRTQTTRIVGVTGATDFRTNPTYERRVVHIDRSFAEVWKVLPGVYEEIGIPVTTVIAGQGIVGNDGYKLRRRIKDVPLGRYIDCGSAQGIPSADTYDIFLTVRTQLVPSEGGSTATTMIEASGRPATLSGDYVKCSTTGRLEERIGEMLGGKPRR